MFITYKATTFLLSIYSSTASSGKLLIGKSCNKRNLPIMWNEEKERMKWLTCLWWCVYLDIRLISFRRCVARREVCLLISLTVACGKYRTKEGTINCWWLIIWKRLHILSPRMLEALIENQHLYLITLNISRDSLLITSSILNNMIVFKKLFSTLIFFYLDSLLLKLYMLSYTEYLISFHVELSQSLSVYIWFN